MSIADALKRVKMSIRDTFHHKPYDPKPGRDRVLAMLETAVKQYENGQTKGRRSWQAGNGGVSFTLELNGDVIKLGDEPTSFTEADEFVPFIRDIEDGVRQGELDDQIKAALESGGGKSGFTTTATSKTPRKRSPQSAITDPNHPKFTDPKWSSLSAGDKIKAGIAYRNKQA